jgi:hypothetical protein
VIEFWAEVNKVIVATPARQKKVLNGFNTVFYRVINWLRDSSHRVRQIVVGTSIGTQEKSGGQLTAAHV